MADPAVLPDGGLLPTQVLFFATDDAYDDCLTQAEGASPDGGVLLHLNHLVQVVVYAPSGVPLGAPYPSPTRLEDDINISDGGGLGASAFGFVQYNDLDDQAGQLSVDGTVAVALDGMGLYAASLDVTMQAQNPFTGLITDGGTLSLSGSLDAPSQCFFGY